MYIYIYIYIYTYIKLSNDHNLFIYTSLFKDPKSN